MRHGLRWHWLQWDWLQWIGLLLILALSLPALAVIETYEFDSEVDRERYRQFIEELRCPKCQNQNLAGSDAPIAEDLRRELHRLIDEGRSDQEITHYMLERYGDFVLYRPRFTAHTAFIWLAPLVLVLIGGLLWWVQLRRNRDTGDALEAPPLDPQEARKLSDLLGDNPPDAKVQNSKAPRGDRPE